MKILKKKKLKSTNGITLIALVITIIVLLILAGISISMLARDNSILQKATDAKQTTEKSEAKEQAKIDIMAWISDQVSKNENSDLDDSKIQEILTGKSYVKEAKATSFITSTGEYEIPYSELYETIKSKDQEPGTTLGENYSDSWIGKTIAYKSEKNNVNEWIILGKQNNAQGKKDVIITTKEPVSYEYVNPTILEWMGYETKIKNDCSNYIGTTGTLGTKAASIKEIRSITLEDINNAVGFTENVNLVTIGGDSNDFAYPKADGSGWIKKGDLNYTEWEQHPFESYYYTVSKFNSWTNGTFNSATISLNKPDNMRYILGNNFIYWVASRSVRVNYDESFTGVSYGVAAVLESGVDSGYYAPCWSKVEQGGNYEGNAGLPLRPVVVLSSEIPWDDIKDLIGNYVTYNSGYDSGSGYGGSGYSSGYDSGSGY